MQFQHKKEIPFMVSSPEEIPITFYLNHLLSTKCSWYKIIHRKLQENLYSGNLRKRETLMYISLYPVELPSSFGLMEMDTLSKEMILNLLGMDLILRF